VITHQPDAGPELSTRIRPAFLTPVDRESVQGDAPVTFVANVVLDDIDPATVTLTLRSNHDGDLWTGPLPVDTQVARMEVASMTSGFHRIELIATSGSETGRAVISVGVCVWAVAQNFDAPLDPAHWLMWGDASRHADGYVELTGNLRQRRGSVFNVDRALNQGDTTLRFRVATGHCNPAGTDCSFPDSDGADGFAMSVFDVDTVQELENILSIAGDGGCMSYGVSGPCGAAHVGGFHIEFDTWNNVEYSDPTVDDHVAITLDGDPSNHVLWTAVPNLEDNLWHQVEIQTRGSHISVWLDDALAIDGDVPGFSFKGGFIGFSGTTGYYTNFHRIDDLQVQEDCHF
jgi:hypothetical protein